MGEMNLAAMIIGGVALLLVLLGLYMLQGKWMFLIAGYNTMPREEQKKYDSLAMARFIGKLLLALAFCMILWIAGIWSGESWMLYIGVALFLVCIGAALMYMNTGGRFLKQPSIKEHKKNK
ncbi:DUF3784 domain-containing protein [Planococcus maritimus]|uniref:DUF3784 domain-containing protein n=1 Tax=Planococcus maritimus TaxID=192421 RepID=UPI0009F2F3E9|nr:DUF3784 domain-containing protein [Planococcus maritimus]